MRRPKLNPASFLKHLFAPKSNALPTGIRARKLVGTKGRSKARLSTYNRMSGRSQEILRQSGMREEYLRGEVSLKDAKAALRKTALNKGYAKPTKAEKAQEEKTRAFDSHMQHTVWAAAKVSQKLRANGKQPNHVNMIKRMALLSDDSLNMAANMDITEIKAYAGDEDNVILMPDGTTVNPLWYN